jgi:DNA-binding IclR family transcriptional regulator
VQEYLSKVPGDLRDIVSLIVKKYNGGPASIIQISKDTKTSVTTAYMFLGELVQLRLLSESKGKYEVTPDVAEMLGRRAKRKE